MEQLSDEQIAYLRSQVLGRIATADADGQPHVTPVGYRYNEETGTIDISGYDLLSTRKVRDIRENPRVAFVVDDLASIKPWRPRGVTIRGSAVIDGDGSESTGFGDVWIRITPNRVVAWGVEEPVFAGK